MKTIKSFFLFLLLFSFILIGCSNKDTTVPSATIQLQNYDEFLLNFKELISALPDFSMIQLEDVPLEDGSICHIFHIADRLTDDTYRLRLDVNKDSQITSLLLRTERKSYGNLQFAVIALYSYQAMNFPDIDADSFYEKYDLFSKEKIYKTDICENYSITSMTIDSTNEITFYIHAK